MSTFFHFSYHVSGLLHVVVCVLKCCKGHPLFLVLLCSWLSIHLRAFTSGKHVHICITLSVCPHITSWKLQGRFLWNFTVENFTEICQFVRHLVDIIQKKSTLVWYTYISARIPNVKPEYLLELKCLEWKL